MNPTTKALLDILSELDIDDTLEGAYNVEYALLDAEHEHEVPLERALMDWRKAGYPDSAQPSLVNADRVFAPSVQGDVIIETAQLPHPQHGGPVLRGFERPGTNESDC